MTRHQTVKVDVFHDGVWNDYSNRTRGMTEITRWISAEGGQADPTDLRLALANEDHLFSVNHPSSALYGRLSKQAPIRVHVGEPPVGAVNSDTIDTTSQVAPEIDAPAGGLLFCAWACPQASASYTVPGTMTATAGATGTRMRLSGARQIISAGGLTGTRTATCSVSEDYVSASIFIVGPTALVTGSVGDNNEDIAIDGTAGDWWVVASAFSSRPNADPADELRPVDFPWDTDGGGWSLVADTGSINVADADAEHLRMRVWVKRVKHTNAAHSIRVTSAPGSEEALSIVFRVPAAQGAAWSARAHCEVAAMPPRRNERGTVKWVPVQAYDLLHRLGSDTQRPVISPMQRFLTRRGNRLVGYWPCEDQPGATSLAAVTPATLPARIVGSIDAGSYAEFVGSAPIPTLRQGGYFQGTIPAHPAGTEYHHMLMSVPSGGLPDGQRLYTIRFGGEVESIQLRYGTGGSMRLEAREGDGGLLDTTGPIAFGVDGQRFMIQIGLVNDGADLDISIKTWEFVGLDLAPFLEAPTDTFTGLNIGMSTRWTAAPFDDPDGLAIGHVAVATVDQIVFGLEDALTAFNGERAGRRIERVLRDADVPVMIVGDPDDTELMGPQISGTVLEIVRSCEAADHGILYGPKEALAVAYRTRASIYNQDAVATLSFDGADNNIAAPWEPDPDTTYVQNDVTVRRIDGTSARSVQETGPLNTGDQREDPAAVGPKPAEVVLNLANDLQPPDHAGWLRLLGTQDEPRFPGITADLVREKSEGNAALVEAVAALDPGDLLVVVDPPDDVTPDDIAQVVLGATEQLSEQVWKITSVGAPGTPYAVAELDDDVLGRADTAGSELASQFVAGTGTTMSVAVTQGPLWTTDVAEFPFDVNVGGVRLHVTAISGASSPQTFTVDQTTVNGVPKTLPAGEDVRLWQPAVTGL